MSKRKRARKKYTAPKGSMRAKGDIVEEIAASMHRMSGVAVERNVFLPAVDGSGREREIDVLISSNVSGYPVHVAVECKNQKEPIEVGDIGEFADKLKDVGIPVQHGIYISTSKYRSGAILRAKGIGIRTFLLEETTPESLSESVQQAFQSLIYLLLTVTKIQVVNNVDRTEGDWQMLIFRDKTNRICGSVPDLVWQEWLSNKVPKELGSHTLDLTIPDDWVQVVDGETVQVLGARAETQITGHIVTLTGSVRHQMLVDASSQRVERSQLKAEFNISSGKYPVTTFSNEEDLEEFIRAREGIHISVGRFRLPRIRLGALYWPPSESTARKVSRLMQDFTEGKIPDPRPLSLAEIEGTDMRTLWKSIWKEYPFNKKPC